MTLPIALQLYTVRDELEKGVEPTLERVAQMGYRAVESAGVAGRTPEEFRALCDQFGLKIVSIHGSAQAMADDAGPTIEQARALGGDHVACSFHGEQGKAASYQQAAKDYDRIGKAFADAGMTFNYHNHGFEFDTLDQGGSGYDILVNETDPRYVKMQLDVYWVKYGGHDPVTWMKNLTGRMPTLHVKDMAPVAPGQDRHFTEIGAGILDIPAILTTAAECGVQQLIVEQDSHWINDSPLESAQISWENLTKLLQ